VQLHLSSVGCVGSAMGLSHVEVIAETSLETGEVRVHLVEVNCRQHNTDFMPLTNACVGYSIIYISFLPILLG